MSDPAHDETEKIIRALEIRVNNEYTQAEKEVQAKLDDYLKRFKKKDETWRKWVNDVKKSDPEEYKKRLEDYKKWKTSQIAVGKRWQEMKQTLAEDLHNANLIARSIATGYMPEIYALNHDYGTYTVESGAMKDTSYTLYDKSTVEYLMRDNPQLLPDPGKDLTRRIYGMLDVRWNRQQLQSVMIQAILQGESIADIATRLANTVGEKNRKAAIRNARTMATGAQNAGRIDSYKRAERLGIKMKQQWLSTHDNRTRHSHRQTDYEIQPVGEKFSNGCRFPGDPEAPAQEVYNCRCTLRGLVDGLEPKARELRDLSEIGDYEEWKKSKKSESNPIDLPEKKAAAIKQAEIAKYKEMAQGVPSHEFTHSEKNPGEKTTEALANAYEYHRTTNNLNVVPYDDIKDLNIVSANYGKLSQETAQAFDTTITKLSREYDTTLQKIRIMTKEEALGNDAFASVGHDYSVDNSLMVINPVKCKDAEKLASRINELSKDGYAVKIQAGKEMEYVPTHEFAHSLINMKDSLSNKTNWVNTDYKKIKEARKEIEWIYGEYKTKLSGLEKKANELELDFLTNLDIEKGEKARELYLQIEKIKLSKYSLNNSDEFLAEAFTFAKIGDGENEYSERVMEILDKYFKR